MIRIEQVLRLVLVVGLAGLVSAEELPPASPCELAANQLHPGGSGTGGTGLRGDEGSGTGGTGLSGHASSGIGGTGLRGDEGSGTGGTGILGTITGFGSICVNGLRIGYDDATPVLRNGEAATAKDLAVGHVVRVTAESGTPLRARRIVMESALSGPVTRVDREARRVWVMGQPVELSDDGVVAALEPGDRAEISGQRRGDGVVVATRIDRSEPEAFASVVGVAESVSGNTAYVADLRAKVASGTLALARSKTRALQRRRSMRRTWFDFRCRASCGRIAREPTSGSRERPSTPRDSREPIAIRVAIGWFAWRGGSIRRADFVRRGFASNVCSGVIASTRYAPARASRATAATGATAAVRGGASARNVPSDRSDRIDRIDRNAGTSPGRARLETL